MVEASKGRGRLLWGCLQSCAGFRTPGIAQTAAPSNGLDGLKWKKVNLVRVRWIGFLVE